MKVTYKDAGVDVLKGDQFIDSIKAKVLSTYGERVESGIGGFASLYKISDDKFLASGSDGVGTKLMLAQQFKKHDTIGIDLVAMCVNDIICTGADPLFFMDYMAVGKLNLETSRQIMDGIIKGCHYSSMALIGGETAEMPDMYEKDQYDLAGFAVGEVLKKDVIDGQKIVVGTSLIGIASSGVHSNGYSLLRKLIIEENLLKESLEATMIYVSIIDQLKKMIRGSILGLAHITGGGLENIKRMNSSFDYVIEKMPSYSEIPSIFKKLQERSQLGKEELSLIFNMGIGMVVATNMPEKVLNYFKTIEVRSWCIGYVERGEGKIKFNL